jgi:hypothetical protein
MNDHEKETKINEAFFSLHETTDPEKRENVLTILNELMNDEQREAKINQSYFYLQAATHPEKRRIALKAMEELIAGRSPEQVAKMEAWHKGTW